MRATRVPPITPRERQWRKRLESWRRSGLTVTAYVRKHGLSKASFFYWKRDLPRRDRLRNRPPQPAMNFVPVRVTAAVPIELSLACGRCLRIAGDFDAAVLKKLLGVLEGGECS